MMHVLESAGAEAGRDEEEGVVKVKLGVITAGIDVLLLGWTIRLQVLARTVADATNGLLLAL